MHYQLFQTQSRYFLTAQNLFQAIYYQFYSTTFHLVSMAPTSRFPSFHHILLRSTPTVCYLLHLRRCHRHRLHRQQKQKLLPMLCFSGWILHKKMNAILFEHCFGVFYLDVVRQCMFLQSCFYLLCLVYSWIWFLVEGLELLHLLPIPL